MNKELLENEKIYFINGNDDYCSLIKSDVDYYYKNIDKRTSYKIVNLEYINENLIQYIKKSNDNLQKSLEIIDFIKSEIGEYTYNYGYQIGWNIKNYFKIHIDMYRYNIVLEKNNIKYNLNNKIQHFLNNNKKNILKQNKYQMYQIYQMYQSKLKYNKIEKVDVNINESKKNIKIDRIMFINKPKNIRYEIQACKPFPRKFEWE